MSFRLPRFLTGKAASQPLGRLPQPGEVFADYQIEKVLGEGGMGVVYKAIEERSGDVVAIKIVQPRHADKETFARRFEQECKFYARLRHSNIVRMRRSGVTQDKVPFIVMDLLTGNPLRRVLDECHRLGRPIDLLPGIHILMQVADAMAFAHKKGIVHRDLKPENIFIGSRGAERGHAWVLDFGIGKMEGGMATDELPAVGTLAYLSPEQAKEIIAPGKGGARFKGDMRSDLYSFGVVVYEVLAARHPFLAWDERPTTDEILAGHLTADPPLVHEVVGTCPPGLSEVARRLLAKDPKDRYEKFAQVAEDLRSELNKALETMPAPAMVARKLEEEAAKAARLSAFASVSLGCEQGEDDEGQEVDEGPGSAARSVMVGVTAELLNFVPSRSALPFGKVQGGEGAAAAGAAATPKLRGKGHTIKMERPAEAAGSPMPVGKPAQTVKLSGAESRAAGAALVWGPWVGPGLTQPGATPEVTPAGVSATPMRPMQPMAGAAPVVSGFPTAAPVAARSRWSVVLMVCAGLGGLGALAAAVVLVWFLRELPARMASEMARMSGGAGAATSVPVVSDAPVSSASAGAVAPPFVETASPAPLVSASATAAPSAAPSVSTSASASAAPSSDAKPPKPAAAQPLRPAVKAPPAKIQPLFEMDEPPASPKGRR